MRSGFFFIGQGQHDFMQKVAAGAIEGLEGLKFGMRGEIRDGVWIPIWCLGAKLF